MMKGRRTRNNAAARARSDERKGRVTAAGGFFWLLVVLSPSASAPTTTVVATEGGQWNFFVSTRGGVSRQKNIGGSIRRLFVGLVHHLHALTSPLLRI